MDLSLDWSTIPDGASLCNLGTLRNVMHFAAQDKKYPRLHCVHVTSTHLEAADGYSACRVFIDYPEELEEPGVPKGDQGLMLWLPDLKGLKGRAQDPVKLVHLTKAKDRDFIGLAWLSVGRAIYEVRTVPMVEGETCSTYPNVKGVFDKWGESRNRYGPAGETAIDPVFFPRLQSLAKALQKPGDRYMAIYLALAKGNPEVDTDVPPAMVALGPVRKHATGREVYAYCLVMPLHVINDGLTSMVKTITEGQAWERIRTEP